MAPPAISPMCMHLTPLLHASRRPRLLSAYTRACNVARLDFHSPLEAMLAALNEATSARTPSYLPLSTHPPHHHAELGALGASTEEAEAVLHTPAGALAAVDALLPPPPPMRASSSNLCGYKLLLYLRHCLDGCAFPTGERLPPGTAAAARAQVCAYLYDPERSASRLRSLLGFDAASSLSILALALEESPVLERFEPEARRSESEARRFESGATWDAIANAPDEPEQAAASALPSTETAAPLPQLIAAHQADKANGARDLGEIEAELGGGAAVPISGDASKVDGYGAGSMAAATRANAAAESTSSLGELLRRAAVCQLDPQARARPHSR